jgi:hypothetical protein
MDKRKSERVQFFQISHERDVLPVWVFNRSNSDAVLGLLLDIGSDGLQILTDKMKPLGAEQYELTIHSDEGADALHPAIPVKHLWSQPDGTLYNRNGFAFMGGTDMMQFLESILSAREAGRKWLRCELAEAKSAA